MLYKHDERRPFYIEIQLEIRGLFVAGSASDYFHSDQMVLLPLPLFWGYLSSYCSANLISDFPGSRGRWSVLFVMLKGTWVAFQTKGLFKGNNTTNTLFATEQANSHCYLKLKEWSIANHPNSQTQENQPSPGFSCTFCLDLWASRLFFGAFPLELDRVLFRKKLSVFVDTYLTFITAIYWFTCPD